MLFESTHKLFQLTIDDGWEHHIENNVYTFLNKEKLEGVVQISSYSTGNKDNFFNSRSELEKERFKHPTAEIVKISEYEAVHYGIQTLGEETIEYFWITGKANIKLFCSMIINANCSESKLNESYAIAFNLLNTLVVNNIFNETE